ncbi:MAG: N-acetylmuramoyl-L-alanine amidase [Clostridia bacterium]|nr:N-acetylmuramoyl-L-alanine amidase [Clostridia bacterium]
MKLKFMKIIAAAGLTLLLSIYVALLCVRTRAAASPSDRFTVVIDAGHGGIDGGVLGITTGVKESELNLDIARKLKTKFDKSGAKTVMTRKTEAGLYGIYSKGFKRRDMQKRKQITLNAKADVFVSIHLNYYSSPLRRGAQVFYKIDDEKSKSLADIVQAELNGGNECDRDYTALAGDYYVLNEADCAAILCECGFLSNAEDEKLLLTDEYRAEIAEKIFNGIEKYRFSLVDK